MNQQQLDTIKARAEAALPGEGSPNMEKVKAMALFRKHAAEDVLALVAEVERLRVKARLLERIGCELVTESNENGYSLEFYNSLYELQEAISDDC